MNRISFIIICKNEGWKITRCLESVFDTVYMNKLNNYEIIYIDSNSIDDSIARAQKFKEVQIYLITTICNAAIARNIGAKVATGNVLFFLDGDMEIITNNFLFFYSEYSDLSYPFLSGNLLYHYYDNDWRLLKTADKPKYRIQEDIKSATTGGLFIIKKDLWDSVGGMRNYLRAGEDGDLGLRLAKRGTLLLRKKELLVHHHMISYLSNKRKWKMLTSGLILYSKCCLYRNNILNIYCWKRMIRHDYSMLILFFSIIFIYVAGSIYPLAIFLLSLIPKTFRRRNDYLSNFMYYLIRDVMVLAGIFLFHPRKKLMIEYLLVKQ